MRVGEGEREYQGAGAFFVLQNSGSDAVQTSKSLSSHKLNAGFLGSCL